jgi:hypothetical protein
MNKWLFCLIILALFGLAVPAPINAATPTPTWTPLATNTPTATLIPVQLTATSKYQNWLVTPTPYTINPGPTMAIRFDTNAGQMANTAINVYRALNFNGVIDTLIFLLLVGSLATMLVKIVNRSTQTHD